MQGLEFDGVFQKITPVLDFGTLLVMILLTVTQFSDQAPGNAQRPAVPQHSGGPCAPAATRPLEGQETLDALQLAVQHKQALFQELVNRETQLEQTLAPLAKAQGEQAELKERLARALAENARLQDEIAGTTRKPREMGTVTVENTSLVDHDTQRKPLYVALIRASVVPVAEPYYRFTPHVEENEQGVFEMVTDVCRDNRQAGESAEQAVAKGSQLDRFLREIDVQRTFVALLVDASSFETFRTVRQMLQERSIPFGWLPCSSPSKFVLRRGQGTTIGEEVAR